MQFIALLKQHSTDQYQEYLNDRKESKKLYFCYPIYESEILTYNDFPDPKEYIIGFFCVNDEKEKSELQSTSSISSRHVNTANIDLSDESIKNQSKPQYLSINISNNEIDPDP